MITRVARKASTGVASGSEDRRRRWALRGKLTRSGNVGQGLRLGCSWALGCSRLFFIIGGKRSHGSL
jgi:hypothetical protein